MTTSDMQIIRDLNSSIQSLNVLIGTLIRSNKSTQPQWYTIDMLAERWSVSPGQVRRIMREYGGYIPKPGIAPRFHIDQVLDVDKALHGRTVL